MKSQVKERKSELSQQLSFAYYALSEDLLQVVKKDLEKTLYWRQRTFYYRLDGFAPIKEIEKPLIEQVFRKYGIEVFKQTA